MTLGSAEVLYSALISLAVGLVLITITDILVRRAVPKTDPADGAKSSRNIVREVMFDEKGYPSIANFQFLAWTLVFIFSLLWVYVVRIWGGVLTPPPDLPTNTLVLMGISTASTIASKAIGTKNRSSAGPPKDVMKGSIWLIFYEEGKPSLARIQFFLWTVVSILIYLSILLSELFAPSGIGYSFTQLQGLTIPDVDPTLVTLMGLSNIGYLGRKALSRS